MERAEKVRCRIHRVALIRWVGGPLLGVGREKCLTRLNGEWLEEAVYGPVLTHYMLYGKSKCAARDFLPLP